MPPLVYHIAGGMFFVPATLFLAVVVLARMFVRPRWFSFLCIIAAILAIAVIAVSAAALPWWFYGCWAALMLAWFCVSSMKRRSIPLAVCAAVLICSSAATVIETSKQRLVPLPQGQFPRLYVLGDSLTAGLGRAGETTWPVMLRNSHGIQIVDLSRAGCTISQAIPIAKKIPPAPGIVLIELGGNDLIGRGGTGRFGSDLDQLLGTVQRPGRQLVMFELPLFPFENAYGIEQRRLASKYNIRLIPRRFLAGILSLPNATIDGIHLSNTGQRELSNLVWTVIEPAMRPEPSDISQKPASQESLPALFSTDTAHSASAPSSGGMQGSR
jgi:lysophospholipase L1-like esterase